jgi:hypothetical protein
LETTNPRALAPAILAGGRGVESALVFVNINTPHDDERAKGLVERQPEPNEDRITTRRDRPMTDTAS